MTIEKAQIISLLLIEQAEKAGKEAAAVQKELSEFAGASQALKLMAKQMPGMVANVEKRIEADESLSKEEAIVARKYSKNIIARFQVMCNDNSTHQLNCQLRAEGRHTTLIGLVDQLSKRSAAELAKAKRREELHAEEERALKKTVKAAKASAAAKQIAKTVGAKPPKPKNGVTKKAAPKKRKKAAPAAKKSRPRNGAAG